MSFVNEYFFTFVKFPLYEDSFCKKTTEGQILLLPINNILLRLAKRNAVHPKLINHDHLLTQ